MFGRPGSLGGRATVRPAAEDHVTWEMSADMRGWRAGGTVMNRILVWDLPTRLFHWLFTGTVVAALGVALIADEESSVFQLHMLLGLIAGFMVLLRLVWGLVGSRYARFGSFVFGPKALLDYLLGTFRPTGEPHIGHNPGSAYAIYAMLPLSLGLALSGLMMSSWEALEELHEVMAYALLVAAGAHSVGIVLHTIRRRENIARSMIDGKKSGEAAQAIRSSHAIAGVVFMILTAGWTAAVFSGHDEQTGRLTLLGQTFRLGESERERSGEHEDDHERRGKRRGDREHRGHDDHDEDHDEDGD